VSKDISIPQTDLRFAKIPKYAIKGNLNMNSTFLTKFLQVNKWRILESVEIKLALSPELW